MVQVATFLPKLFYEALRRNQYSKVLLGSKASIIDSSVNIINIIIIIMISVTVITLRAIAPLARLNVVHAINNELTLSNNNNSKRVVEQNCVTA